MVDREGRQLFDQAFRQRLRLARESKGLEIQEVADYIGIPKDTYGKYETRSMIPMAYFKAACELMGTDPWRVITGEPWPLADSAERAHAVFLGVLKILADRKVTDMTRQEVETWAAFLADCLTDDLPGAGR